MSSNNYDQNCRITLSANAGISVSMRGSRVWVDALHNIRTEQYSTITPEMLEIMRECEAFTRPDAIVYTHCHNDHFSYDLTLGAMREWPDAVVALPEKRFERQLVAEGGMLRFRAGSLEVTMLRLPHDGEEYADVDNYACVISPADGGAGHNILVLGDAALGCPELTEQLEAAGFGDETGGWKIDVAVVDFPWAAVTRGRTVIDNILRPGHLLICHLPFPEEDKRGYGDMIRRVLKKFRNIEDIRILDTFLQTEII